MTGPDNQSFVQPWEEEPRNFDRTVLQKPVL